MTIPQMKEHCWFAMYANSDHEYSSVGFRGLANSDHESPIVCEKLHNQRD